MCDRPLVFACRKWKPGQPDDWGHGHEVGEDCAGLIHEGLWNDFFCEDLISYICEKELETCTSAVALSCIPTCHCIVRLMSSCPSVLSLCSGTASIVATPREGACSEQLRHPPCGTGPPARGEPVRRERRDNFEMGTWLQQRTSVQRGGEEAFLLPREFSPTLPAKCNNAGQSQREGFHFSKYQITN